MTKNKKPSSSKRSYNRGRGKTVRVKTAKGRKKSSTQWLKRQLNDPYVRQAQADGYRSRAVYKIKEIHKKFDLFKPGKIVVDLGAAPGGWSQYALECMTGANGQRHGQIIGIDLLDIEPIEGVSFLKGDFTSPADLQEFEALITEPKVDVVMSDMAANTSGHVRTDHMRIIALVEQAWQFAERYLNDGGSFVAKVFQGGAEKELLDVLKAHFEEVKHVKPQASRQDSRESYLVAHKFTPPQ